MELRPVTIEEIGAAHRVYLEVVDWLKALGVRQWLRALPEEVFRERQARGELFAGHLESRMAAIVTIAFEEDADWSEVVGPGKNWWIKTLATNRAFRRQNLGGQVMQACETRLIKSGAREVWLECVDAGFLPDYYAQFGYAVIKCKTITYPSGNTFEVTLMRKDCVPDGPRVSLVET
jgi:GNAT superfamily N-acetyltransferase